MEAPNLLLRGLRWWSRGQEHRGEMRLRRGRIVETGADLDARSDERALDLAGYLALPGLINAHDHLGLDLMPPLGDPPYSSFYSWAQEIYRPEESPVRELLSVAEADRLLWGGYRNLCSGVTTVVHHDPYHRRVFSRRFPVRVPRVHWSHSLGFAKNLVRDHRQSSGKPWVVHAAEGIDERARQEIDKLEELGVLGSGTVLVHGTGITKEQEALLAKRRVALVWCPASNLGLYGSTAPVDRLQDKISVVLGTDSTLSGSLTLLDELREAAGTGLATPEDLLAMVTDRAATVFGLSAGEGALEPGGVADLLLLEDSGAAPAEQLLAAKSETLALVLVRGRPGLADPEQAARLGLSPIAGRVQGSRCWLTGDLAGLRHRIEAAAGPEVLQRSPLWGRLGSV